eukprot:GEMP01141822.1.p1 GENE.GEMP01141822.1~~GEMP01141822.1.p1  ORF type:complete len:119 (+),score=17.21 GEMP01141822.1:43-357(+)
MSLRSCVRLGVAMADISAKKSTMRTARAAGSVRVGAEIVSLIKVQAMAKGDVLTVSQVAGIMAAKRTADILPLCHPSLPLSKVTVELRLREPDTHAYMCCVSVR